MTEAQGSRAAGAGGSRAALLVAARELFAERGFDHTTVRAIAERAGVNQALLFRHFGDKDALFAAVLSEEATALLASAAPADLLAVTLQRMFDDGAHHPLFAALRSPGHDAALSALRDELAAPYRAALVARTEGTPQDSALRADLLLAWLLGIGFARSVLDVPSLRAADPDAVVAHVERAARALLRPEPGQDDVSGV